MNKLNTGFWLGALASGLLAAMLPTAHAGQIATARAWGNDQHCGGIDGTFTTFEAAFSALRSYTHSCPFATELLQDSCSQVNPDTVQQGGSCSYIYAKQQGDRVGGYIDWGACPAGQGVLAGTTQCRPTVNLNVPTKPSARNGASCPAGNPIYPITGSKREVVDTGLQLGLLALQFTYDSRPKIPVAAGGAPAMEVNPEILGVPWTSSFHRRVFIQSNLKGALVTRGDGNSVSFEGNGTGTFTAEADTDDRLVKTATGYLYFDMTARSQETYDSNGTLTKITWSDGRSVSFTYGVAAPSSSMSALLRAEDQYGRYIDFAYTVPGGVPASSARLLTVSTASGQQLELAYTATGVLQQIIWADARTRQFLYEKTAFPWALTGVIDEAAKRYSKFEYDDQGRAISTEHAGGVYKHSVTYTSPPQITVSEESDSTTIYRRYAWQRPEGTTVLFPGNVSSNHETVSILGKTYVTKRSQPAGSGCNESTSTQAYDDNGNVKLRDDFNGHRACYAYDLSRNLQTVAVEGLSNTAQCSTVVGSSTTLPTGSRKTSTQWHPQWPLPVVVAEPLKKTTYIYNGQPDTTAMGSPVLWCAPTGAQLPDLSPIAVLCKKVEQATTDANGSQGFAATLDPAVATRAWSYDYNQYGQLLTETDPALNVTTYTYYPADGADYRKGDLQSIKPPLIPAIRYTKYNAAGQVLQSIDASGVITNHTYDAHRRLLSSSVSTATGNVTTTYEWHSTGLLKKVTQPNASFVEYFHDDAHRLTSVKDQLGNSITYEYDAMGNRKVETVKDPNSLLARQVARTFDALNRLQTLRPGAAQ